jgi:hypothetical protein
METETYNEFMEALRSTTRGFEDILNKHADETRKSLSALDKSMAVTANRINVIGEIVKPLPTQIARLETTVTQVAKSENEQWTHITKVRGEMRDLSIKMAEKANNNNRGFRNSERDKSFWDGPNAKLVILLITTIAIGLLSLAGYQVTK